MCLYILIMEDICGIYKIKNKKTNETYIGQSIHINQRFKEHIKGNKKPLSAIDKDIQLLGKDNFIFEIIEECSENKLNEREIYWIDYYNTYLGEGYNKTLGGDDTSCAVQANEMPVEQYDLKGNYIATYKSISEAGRQLNIQPSNIGYCCNNNPRYSHAGGFLWKFKDSNKEIKPIIKKIHSTKKRTLGQYTLEDKLITTFPSAMEAERQIQINHRHISEVCNKQRKSAGGYHWKYIE